MPALLDWRPRSSGQVDAVQMAVLQMHAYLPLYVAEFQFRHNNRFNPDMFRTAIEFS